MAVDPLADVMQYYHFNFILLYCLAAIVILVTIVGFRKPAYLVYSILISTVSGFGIIANFFFMGVLADNNAIHLSLWWNQAIIIAIACFVMWLAQFTWGIFFYRKDKQK